MHKKRCKCRLFF